MLSTLPSLPFNFPIEDRDITSTYLGTESMSINLPTECKINENSELSFRMLKGKMILSPANIGFWTQIYHDEIPDSKIIFLTTVPFVPYQMRWLIKSSMLAT